VHWIVKGYDHPLVQSFWSLEHCLPLISRPNANLMVALLRLIFENMHDPPNRFNMSSRRGIGNQYWIVILLMARLFTHIRQLQSFSGVKRIGTTYGLMLFLICPESVLGPSPLEFHSPLDSSGSVGGWVDSLWGSDQCGAEYS